MEDDNEVLDWGYEDDEHPDSPRKSSFDHGHRRDGDDANEDAEDEVSLGEDEDDAAYRRDEVADLSVSKAKVAKELPSGPPSAQKAIMDTGANDERSQQARWDTARDKDSTSNRSRTSARSPRRKRDSTEQSSPQRSTRLTHALPPKPVSLKVPYLPPSHPSIVSATSMITVSPRASAREATKKANGATGLSSLSPDELPPKWERRESRSGGGNYYYNTETSASTWEHPVSIPSTSSYADSRTRRTRSPSTDIRRKTPPPESNLHNSQTTRGNRRSAHVQADYDVDDAKKTPVLVQKDLSYEDRHYRPGGEAPAAIVDIRPTTERAPENSRIATQSRYNDRGMPPASPPSRRRARSSSLPNESRTAYLQGREKDQSSRGTQQPARGRAAYTNDEPSMQREFDSIPPERGYPERRWMPAPHAPPSPADRDRNDRGPPRRDHRRQVDGDNFSKDRPFEDRNRPEMRRRASSRGPRDREPPRQPDLRDQPKPIFESAPSTLSASSHPYPLLSYPYPPAIHASLCSRLTRSLVGAVCYVLSYVVQYPLCCCRLHVLFPPPYRLKDASYWIASSFLHFVPFLRLLIVSPS
ncbi:hypothetical protein B0H34DRAFT_475409 [Crassisporium funariophilum]|nr:hypothetical protein B0H34DRAFT_475409 [Crassisporium funariophilum]